MEAIKDVAEYDQRQQSANPGTQNVPDQRLYACLYSLLANLRNVTSCDIEKALLCCRQPEPSKSAVMNLLQSLLRFDPAETASKIRSHSDAQSLFDLLFHVSS